MLPSPDEVEVYFVTKQAGRVVRYARKTRAKSTWIDIADRVVFGGKPGLLGLAFPGVPARPWKSTVPEPKSP